MRNPALDPALIERARAMWDEGKTATEIAKALGKTKNSIVSIAHRKKFPPRASPITRVTDKVKAHLIDIARRNPHETIREMSIRTGLDRKTVVRLLAVLLPSWAAALRERLELRRSRAERAPAVRMPARRSAGAGPGDRGGSMCRGNHSTPAPRALATDPTDPPVPSPQPRALPDDAVAAGDDSGEGDGALVRRLVVSPVRGCHWPIGEPGTGGFRFCGDPRDGGRMPYCARHRAQAVAKPRDEQEAA